MYAVVGCGDCGALWVVANRPDTTTCPRCGTRHEFGTLRRLVTTEDADEARQARATLLADRQGHGAAFADLDPFADMADAIPEAGPDDETYLEGAGVDAAAAGDAGERADRGAGSTGTDRLDVVRTALRELDAPDERAVVEYATERGVDAEFARVALERLVRTGAATEHRGAYRLV